MNFNVFHPIGEKRCTNETKSSDSKFHPHWCSGEDMGLKNCKFNEIAEYKRSARAYPLRDTYEIFGFCGQFHGRLKF